MPDGGHPYRSAPEKIRQNTKLQLPATGDVIAMNAPDGMIRVTDIPAIPVVFFGDIDGEIQDAILQSLQGFLASLDEQLLVIPRLQVEFMVDPGIPGGKNRSGDYYSALHSVQGNLVLGVTGNGLWDEFPHPRFVFGSAFCGTAILSLHRFIHDSASKGLALTRIGKEIPKILALACGIPACSDQACYLSYHWTMEDIDRNRYVCRDCRMALGEAIGECVGMGIQGS